MEITQSPWEMALRMAIALLFGGIVGWEREAQGRPAGLRTHMLVALGAAGFTLVAVEILEMSLNTDGATRMDATRILGSIVGGVGFLGAGAIITSGGKVRGLTTAAGLWVVAAVGVAAGAGHYVLSVMLVCFTIITLTVVRVASVKWLAKKSDDD